jgi:CheY-like chemotaxis protein
MQSPGINGSRRQAAIKPTALVVDDHPEMLRRVSALLGSRYDVVGVARDGYEAIDLARSLAPDLIVLDIAMPRLDGFQVAARLQEFGLAARTVVMTLHDDEDLVKQAFLAGARGFVHKTRLAVDLVRALDHVYEGRFFLPTLQSLLTVAGSGAHAVQFHSYDRRFILDVSGLINCALRRGHVAAVVANAAVRAGVAEQLKSYGWNVGVAGDYGRYHAMDAAESLAGIMRDDRPDPERLGESVAALERLRVETADPSDGRLTLVGEIAVPLLLNGNAKGAMEIERLWNALTRGLPWLGVCCYPVSCFADRLPPHVFHEVCAEHGAVGHAA